MKIKLESPPEGFETEARLIDAVAALRGDRYLRPDGSLGVVLASRKYVGVLLVLTPKKKRFWRLDPVATFEEATQSKRMTRPMGLASSLGGDEPMTYWASADCGDVQWWRWTVSEELP